MAIYLAFYTDPYWSAAAAGTAALLCFVFIYQSLASLFTLRAARELHCVRHQLWLRPLSRPCLSSVLLLAVIRATLPVRLASR